MKSGPLALLAVSLLSANARAGYEEDRARLELKAQADRIRLGYDADREKFDALYPTPEMSFATDTKLVPGQAADVRVKGRFGKDTAVLVTRDDVTLVSSKPIADAWNGKLQAKPDAWPGVVELAFVAPVTGNAAEFAVATIVGKFALELELENGWIGKLTFDAGAAARGPVQTTSQWFKPGQDKPFRTARVELSITRDSIVGQLEPSAEEEAAGLAGADATMAAVMLTPAEQAQLDTAMARLSGCARLKEPAKMATCMEKAQAALEAIQAAQQQRIEAAQAGSPAVPMQKAFGCSTFSVSRGAGGAFGEAHGCEDAMVMAARRVSLRLVGK
jgi:hypothetical protein